MHEWVRGRRKWAVLGVAGALATAITVPTISFADSANGCDFQQNGADACVTPLTGTTFAGGDGNLLASPTNFGTTDWQNVAGRNAGVDLASGSGDNAFGQGTKEDSPNVSVVDGSIPPNKSDLIRFYEASQFASGNNYLYLAWERTNVLGSANFDFEINQKTQPDLTTTGAKTLVRTAGDLLVTFDFTNGGGRPTIGLLSWVTTGAASQCFSSNTVPCWGNAKTLGPGTAIAAVNTDTVTDPIDPNAPRNLPGLTFGETAINLTAAGVFPTGTCEAFGSAFVRSRSSASFTAEIKDFVAPIPVNISNCGEVKVIKHTDPRGLNQSFSYTSNLVSNPPAGSTGCTSDSTPSSFTLNDSGNTTSDNTANTEDCLFVPAGSYNVTEGAPAAGFTLESLTCTATGAGSSGSQDSTTPAKANITVAPNGVVTCTYVNQGAGAILVTKTGKDKNCVSSSTTISNGTCTGAATAVLSGAKFTVNGVQKTTGANGQACFDGLTIGTSYSVTEDSAPTGYGIDAATRNVTVTKAATCTSGSPDPVSVTDTPLTNILARATAVVQGTTNSTVNCTNAAGSTVATSGTNADPATAQTTTGLAPGTYTCTIVIDP